MKRGKKQLLVIAGGLVVSGAGFALAPPEQAVAVNPVSDPAAMEARPVDGSGSAPTPEGGSAETLKIIAVTPDSEQAAPPGRASGNRMIEEVIVTAQKREESIKDVPISIQAFSGEQLDAKQVLNISDLPKVTPGLNITTFVGLTAFFLRGVGSDATVLGDPQVVTYVDNVYFPSGFGQLQDFGSVESVEVLKGPQGTLFGRNALGGAIRVQTKDPSLEKFEGSLGASYGSFDAINTRAYLSVPIGDTLALSVSGLYNEAENSIDGRHTANFVPLPKETQEGYRAKLLWKPAEWADLRLNVYDFSSDGAATYNVNTNPSLIGQAALIQGQDPRHGFNNTTVQKPTDVTTYFGQLSFYTSVADIKLFGSKQKLVDQQSVDFDGSAIPIAVFQARGFSDAKTAELQIVSNEDTPGSDWFEWVAGVYYFNALAGFNPAYLTAGGTDLEEGIVGGVTVPQSLLDLIYAAADASGLPIPAGAQPSFVGSLKTKSIAYYGQVTAKFTDWASLTLGLRYQDEDRIVDESSSGLALLNSPDRIVYQNYSGYRNDDYRDRTKNADPKVSLNFRPGGDWLGKDALLYLSYQTATTSSTFNVINIYDGPEQVKATEIAAYEAGIKTRLLDGLIDLNAAVFDYDMKNPQVQTISLLAGGAVRFENAEKQRIKGAEFDALVQLFPELTNGNLVMTLSGTYLNAVYTSFKDGSGFSNAGVYSGGQNFSGHRVVRTPKYSATAGLLQSFSIGSGTLELGVDYYYNDGFFYLAQNSNISHEPRYDTLGANVSYLYEPWRLRVGVFGRNLLNEEYNLSRFVNDFGANDIIAPRATYGMRMNIDF